MEIKHQILLMNQRKDRYWRCINDLTSCSRRNRQKKVLAVLGEMQKRPMATTENVVAFLSSLSNDFANQYGIQNRVVVVSEDRKVISKHRMLETVQAKIEVIEHKFREIIKLFKPLVDRGIHFF